MDNLKDLLKRFIEEERNKDTGSNEQQINSELEGKLNGLGFDTDTIRDFINSLPSEENTDQVIESIFRLIGREITYAKPIRVSDDGFVSRSVSTKETEQGLEREILKPLIIAACGKVIKEEEIGVRCSICNQYDDKEHAFVCHRCGSGMCIQHTLFFKNEKGENIPYCPSCYKEVIYNQYTW